MIQRIVETAICAADLDAAERFYADVLGLPVVARQPGRHVFFRVGTEAVFLVFNPEATLGDDRLPSHGTRGSGHFAFGIPAADYESWKARLQGHGVAIEREATWPPGGRSIYFRDPAGNLAELVTPGVWQLPSGW